MCDELLRCFRRRSAKVESFWPGAEPASLPRGCSLIQTCCMHPHARRTHILSHALKHPSHGAVTRLVLRSPRFPNYILHIQLWIDFLRRAASSVPPHSEEEAVGTVGSGKRQAAFFKDVTGVALYSLIVNKSHEKMTPRIWLLSYKYFGWLGFVAVHMAAKYLLRIYGFVATNIYKKSWLLIKNIWFCHHKHVCKKSWLLINIIQFCRYKPDCRTSWLLTKIIQFCCHKHNSKISWLLV